MLSETSKFFCNHCTTIFYSGPGNLSCPKCHKIVDPKYRFSKNFEEVKEEVVVPEVDDHAEEPDDSLDID